ncbi:MAG: cob(I)yrinic acid a,c-diamide adenosyltransferase [Paludibacteraceae bacterium]|nr:cob(I)yrinic acid a,c-diamide adenosyltransferase [Paludibacteraceae bacterium]
MKIYTKTGDKGTTSLIGGKRVLKNSDKLNAYGSIDELNSFLGLLRAKTTDENIKNEILDIQNTLFNVGAHLALDENVEKIPEFAQINDEKIKKIEDLIDFFQENLPKITNFIIYGENELSAICHVCRAICRRAEREIITVNQQYNIDSNVITYVNRLSDFLFVLARVYTKNEEKSDFLWKK